MFLDFITRLKPGSNDALPTRRVHTRRDCDKCISVVGGRAYPVENWSPGGLLISGDGRLLGLGQDVPVTLKFRLRNVVLNLDHTARVVRKNGDMIALKFQPLSDALRRGFQQVIDDHVSREFAESQMA